MLNTKRKRQRSAAAITAAAEVSENRQESLIKEMTFASTALGNPEMRTLAAVNAVSKRHQTNATATTKRTRDADDDDDASYCCCCCCHAFKITMLLVVIVVIVFSCFFFFR